MRLNKRVPKRLRQVLVFTLGFLILLNVVLFLWRFFTPRLVLGRTRITNEFRLDGDFLTAKKYDIEQYGSLTRNKIDAGERIFEWIIQQKDLRWTGIYADNSTCELNNEKEAINCVNPAQNGNDYVSNNSFAAPLWGLLKYYQRTKDENVLNALESDLVAVERVLLNFPEEEWIINNSWHCLYLKDIALAKEVSPEGKDIARRACLASEYVLAPVEEIDPLATESAEMTAVMTYYRNQTAKEVAEVLADMIVANSLAGEVKYNAETMAGQLEYLYAAVIENENLMNEMDMEMRTKIILALELYREKVGDDQEGRLAKTVGDLYAGATSIEEMTTAEVTSEAMLQYHLGRSLYRQQSKLLRDFYSEVNSFGGIKPLFIKQTQAQGNVNLLLTADIKLNGELLGVLSI